MLDTQTFQELEYLVPPVLRAGKVPFIQGKPGAGKSSFWRKIARDLNYKFIDIRLATLEPTMMNGFIWLTEAQDKATFKSLDLFPVEGDELPINPETKEPYEGFFVHLDEFTQMPKSVEGAAFRLILDKEVGDKKLHEKVLMACSGNPPTKGMLAKPITLPMRSRIVHYEMENNLDSFTETMIKLDFHTTVINYINSDDGMRNTIEKCLDNIDGAYACERSWEDMSDIIKEIEKNGKVVKRDLPTLRGTVGDAAGNGLLTFIEHYYATPDINVIIQDPKNAPKPDKLEEQYAALAFLVGKVTENNAESLAAYIQRFDEEMQLIFGRILMVNNEDIFTEHFLFIADLIAEYAL